MMEVSFFTDLSRFTRDMMPAMNATNPTTIKLIPMIIKIILLREPIIFYVVLIINYVSQEQRSETINK